MKVTAAFSLVVKEGSPPEHNDDAAASDVRRGRFAVSDGATESGFSRVWSKILVEEFVRCDAAVEDLAKWIPGGQQRWLDELKTVKIPWYGQQQFELGAFATMLGVIVEFAGVKAMWRSVAIGDSCLFHLRANKLLKSFPLEKSADFNSTPRLIGSRSPADSSMSGRAVFAAGELESSDTLFLMSDAIAKWCLSELEVGRPAWPELHELFTSAEPESAIAAWVSDARARRGLHNDDVTIMQISFS